LLDVVSDLLGPDISLNPVNHVRMKVPVGNSPGRVGALTGTTPWHQDRGACLTEADDSKIVIAWIPLNQPSVETGTLRVVPGSHKQGLLAHSGPDPSIRAGSIEIPEENVDVERAIPILVDPGDIVLMTMDIVHGSLPNQSASRVRMSAEIRFQRTGDHSGRNPALPILALRENGRRTDLDAAAWRGAWLKARTELANEPAINWHRW
jgi:phytanoyl-CoA hydroxylase